MKQAAAAAGAVSPRAGSRRRAARPGRRRSTAGGPSARRGVAPPRHRRSLFLSPVDRRVLGLLRLPARDERVPLVHALRPAAARRAGSGSPTTATCSARDPQVWPAVRNTLWMIAVAVPLQVLFAFGVALMLTRAQARRRRSSARSSTCPRSCRPSRRRSASSTCSTRPPGRSTRSSASSASRARSGSTTRAGRSRRSCCSALWGDRQHDGHLPGGRARRARGTSYESAELDGAGALQRLRWVTLPTISPVILFAVVIGVIQGLQYFTQAYVAASVAAGQASQAGR